MTWDAFLFSQQPYLDAQRLQGCILSLIAYTEAGQKFVGQASAFCVKPDYTNFGKPGLCCTVQSDNWQTLDFTEAQVSIFAGDFRYLYAAQFYP